MAATKIVEPYRITRLLRRPDVGVRYSEKGTNEKAAAMAEEFLIVILKLAAQERNYARRRKLVLTDLERAASMLKLAMSFVGAGRFDGFQSEPSGEVK
jgi:hypothetical protein